MKLIVTGGHISPLLAVLPKLPKSCEVLLVGRKHAFEGDSTLSLEYQTAQKLGVEFAAITTGRFQRTFTKYTIPSLFKIPFGFFQAYRIVKAFKPDVILSFGGYVSFPVVLAGAILRIPIVIHEQTFSAGLANRIAGRFARKICISYEKSERFFPRNKTVLTGNPVRNYELRSMNYELSDEKIPLLYITGGSAGSHDINILIEGCLEKLLQKFRVIHQTGDAKEFGDFKRLEKFKQSLNEKSQKRYVLTKFVDPSGVGSIMNASDLVVSRAGINTVTELLYFGKPALFIPLNNEQKENADILKNLGICEVVKEESITSETLYERIDSMVTRLEKYKLHKYEAKKLVTEDSAEKIVEIVEKIALW